MSDGLFEEGRPIVALRVPAHSCGVCQIVQFLCPLTAVSLASPIDN